MPDVIAFVREIIVIFTDSFWFSDCDELQLYNSIEEDDDSCILCGESDDDPIEFGKKVTVDDITVHHFCLVSIRFGFGRLYCQKWNLSVLDRKIACELQIHSTDFEIHLFTVFRFWFLLKFRIILYFHSCSALI